jgi:hypothetical protein
MKKALCKKEIILYLLNFRNPRRIWHPKLKKRISGIKDKDKNRYILSIFGKNLSPKKKMIAKPIKTVKILIKKLKMMLVPKIWRGLYFSLFKKYTTAKFKPKPVKIKSKEGNKTATEYMPCPFGPKTLAIITVIIIVDMAVATLVKNVINAFLAKTSIVFNKIP